MPDYSSPHNKSPDDDITDKDIQANNWLDSEEIRFERQLKRCRPRSPQINLSSLNSPELLLAQSNSSIPLPVEDTSVRVAPIAPLHTGYSTTHFFIATTASWILGVLVGGVSILYAMSVTKDSVAQSTLSSAMLSEANRMGSDSANALPSLKQNDSRLNPSADAVTASETNSSPAKAMPYPLVPRRANDLESLLLHADSPWLARVLTNRGLIAPTSEEQLIPISSEPNSVRQQPSLGDVSNRKKLMEQYLSSPRM